MAECELTEIEEAWCACRRHRGGRAPAEEVSTERKAALAELAQDLNPRVFAAKYPGECIAECGEAIEVDQMIVGAPGVGYMHLACAP